MTWSVRIFDAIRCLGMWAFVAALSLFPVPRRQSGGKKLLVIRLDAIGDFVLWLDAARDLRRLYPQDEYRITLLGNDLWAPLAEDLDFFDRVWPVNRKRYLRKPLYFVRLLLQVRRESFDVVINPTISREFKFGDLLAGASLSPVRIGATGDLDRIRSWQRRIGDRWYTRLIPAGERPLMELEQNAEFMRGLGAAGFRASLPELPQLSPLPKGFSHRDYAVVVPGAGGELKKWPVARFAEIADRIYEKTGWVTIVCGGPEDRPLGETIATGCAAPVENWCGRTTLPELVAVVAGARIVVANDTGAVHIAAAVSVPAVCILGGGHPGRFLPYRIESPTDRPLPVPVQAEVPCSGCGWVRCPSPRGAAAPCIDGITVDQVWSAVAPILEQRGE